MLSLLNFLKSIKESYHDIHTKRHTMNKYSVLFLSHSLLNDGRIYTSLENFKTTKEKL